MKKIYISRSDKPYVRLYRAILQQAISDFDKVCFYKKHGVETFNDFDGKLNVEKEYADIMRYFNDIKENNILNIDVDTIIKLIKEKNGL